MNWKKFQRKCAANHPVRLEHLIADNDCGELLVRPIAFLDFIASQGIEVPRQEAGLKVCISKELQELFSKRERQDRIKDREEVRKFERELRKLKL